MFNCHQLRGACLKGANIYLSARFIGSQDPHEHTNLPVSVICLDIFVCSVFDTVNRETWLFALAVL